MELNQKVGNMLTPEQKANFQKDNGKFKLLNHIVIVPIISTLLGIYLENFIIVGVSIALIIAFLILKTYSFTHRNLVYEKEIIPIVLNEIFEDVLCMDKDEEIKENFKKSQLVDDYDKVKVDRTVVIRQPNYVVNVSKINILQENVEENDGVVDKEIEDKMSGLFAYTRLPSKSLIDYKVIRKGLNASLDDLIKIPNMDFDRAYDVYAKSPVEVRNILSYGVMARILDFDTELGKIISFSIVEDMLYIAIDYPKFLEFKGKGKTFVIESQAQEDLRELEILDMFITYIMNMYQR